MISPAHDDGAWAGAQQSELFARRLTATFPSENSQAGIALAYLLKPVRLRQSEWLHVGWRLAAAINDLINLGWPIVSIPVHEHGRKRPVAEYSMPQWVLTALAGRRRARELRRFEIGPGAGAVSPCSTARNGVHGGGGQTW